MAEQAKGAGEPQVDVERERFVRISSGKTVTVRKWSYTRSNQAGRIVREVVGVLPKDGAGKVEISDKGMLDLFTDGVGAERMLDLVRLSVDKESVDLIHPEMDGDDAYLLIEAAVALNGGAVKKASALPSLFVQILAGMGR